jgi:hypothetical protein
MIVVHANYARCSQCQALKERTEFYRSSRRAGAIQAYCKPCHKERQRRWSQTEHGRAVNNANARRGYERTKADPRRHAIRQAQDRLRYEERKRRAARNKEYAAKMRNSRRRASRKYARAKQRGLSVYPQAPFRDFLHAHWRSPREVEEETGLFGATAQEQWAGVRPTVRVSVVDRVVTETSFNLCDIYDPETYPKLFR